MTRTQIIRFRHSLEARRAELLRSVHELRGRLAIDSRGDALDRGRKTAEREVVLRSIDLESELLRRVEGALAEIREGTFGICAACDRAIPIQRLEAVPWSPYCVSCQEAAEARDGTGSPVRQGEPYAFAG